ncbi:MAG: hypothetical protein QW303_01700 [Nitrososphaerota archaeon]
MEKNNDEEKIIHNLIEFLNSLSEHEKKDLKNPESIIYQKAIKYLPQDEIPLLRISIIAFENSYNEILELSCSYIAKIINKWI